MPCTAASPNQVWRSPRPTAMPQSRNFKRPSDHSTGFPTLAVSVIGDLFSAMLRSFSAQTHDSLEFTSTSSIGNSPGRDCAQKSSSEKKHGPFFERLRCRFAKYGFRMK